MTKSLLKVQISWTRWEDTLDSRQHMARIAAYCQLSCHVDLDSGSEL